MRFILTAVVLLAAAGFSFVRSPAAARQPCVVPRLYALRLAPARTLILKSGCRLGGISRETNDAVVVRIVDQVPAPGAILPRSTRVFLIVS